MRPGTRGQSAAATAAEASVALSATTRTWRRLLRASGSGGPLPPNPGQPGDTLCPVEKEDVILMVRPVTQATLYYRSNVTPTLPAKHQLTPPKHAVMLSKCSRIDYAIINCRGITGLEL